MQSSPFSSRPPSAIVPAVKIRVAFASARKHCRNPDWSSAGKRFQHEAVGPDQPDPMNVLLTVLTVFAVSRPDRRRILTCGNGRVGQADGPEGMARAWLYCRRQETLPFRFISQAFSTSVWRSQIASRLRVFVQWINVGVSSGGRAPDCDSGGQRFESATSTHSLFRFSIPSSSVGRSHSLHVPCVAFL